ncbi:TetR/AcrR family transcriptional regulator [Dickeya chrysanthemi]|uniref:TetR/AcrR family transcriptional regulator n=1 Tax=Dickeya TaxID=204037 RepID=UPI000532ABD5|nr:MULTISPECIES: TetR/AcrR family transcriptional regulator [Dickeya]TYL43939.1 TetR/AcrR family transcriptional regulator [Dickeya sp. ws52]WJM84163.1 TetR/AcrR family transcriptional regulator [Dickeya chrysanthemi]
MARPRSEEKAQAILEAASLCFAERGISASTAMIAKHAGLSEGTLFRYFPSKEELINELYLYLKKDLCAYLSNGFSPSASLEVRARFLWFSYISWGVSNPSANITLSHLDIGDLITSEIKQKAAEFFPDMGVDEAFVQSPVFNGLSRGYADTVFQSLADSTVKFASRYPENAEAYKEAGFAVFWKLIN